jgi:hypothetical protein
MRLWIACSCVLALLAAGCGGNGPVTVTGAVTLDGKPVGAGNSGTIRFQPADPATGQSAEGFIKDGRYEAKVLPGRYEVTISWQKWPDKEATKGHKPPPGFDEIPPEQLIPAKYTKAGTLSADVSAEKSQTNFPLVSK